MANILLIDDEPLLLGLISNTLRLDGHNVSAMCDPLKALASVSAGQTFDLVVTDVDIGPISGFELVKRLGKTGFSGSVLFMSGYPALVGAVAERLGERTTLEKPFTAAQSRSAVGKALRRAKPKKYLQNSAEPLAYARGSETPSDKKALTEPRP